MAEVKQNLQSAQVIAKIFGVTPADVENLRRKKIITGYGSPKQYDMLPAIQDYIRYLQESTRYKSGAEIASVFGVSTRRIEQLKTEGVIKGDGKPTKYDFDATVKDYVAFLSDKAYGREEKQTKVQTEEKKLNAEADWKTHKARIAELQVQELEGKMHRSEDVEAMTNDIVYAIRSMILALPGRLAIDVMQATTANEASAIIRSECYKVLEELSEYKYDPDEYQRRAREREGWGDPVDDEEDE